MSPDLPTVEQVVDYLRSSARGPLKSKELARGLDVETDHYGAFQDLLGRLEREGQVYRVKGRRYAVPEKINLVVGRLSVTRKGDGFVAPASPRQSDQDLFIPAADLGSAMHGDRVVARIEGRPRGRNPVGRIIKVLERAHPRLVGTYHRSRRFGFVEPRDRKVKSDVLIPSGEEGEARDGEVVVVKLTSYGDGKLNPSGTVETVLGPIDEPGVDILSVLHGHGLAREFPPAALEEARSLAERERTIDPRGRTDRRDLHLFTIDPADAKDHDDALSITRDGEGLWEVGIHIADVAHFVEAGGPIDAEAFERGTSVYLVDRVVPMLPHELSSDLCSLRPDEDRYAVSLFLTLNRRGEVEDHHFERTVIRSRHRLAYEEVQEVLDGDTGLDSETDGALRQLDRLATVLREAREKRGSLDFDLPEARVILGDEGEPVEIQRMVRLRSHRLVEEFMLLANELVAREATRHEVPLLYRIHEPPLGDALDGLRDFLGSLGYRLPRGQVGPADLQQILEKVEGTPHEQLVSTVILRSMNRARYAADNVGHFGLASEAYAHFTSPIRRYPDLVVHRAVIQAFIEGRTVEEVGEGGSLDEVGEWCSDRERIADEAERDSIELKKVEFMERHLGDIFEGTISGVTSFGFFVLLDQVFVEGLVHVNALDDYYVFHEDRYALVGDRSGRRFELGDRVKVQVARTDKEERHIDFELLEPSSGRSR